MATKIEYSDDDFIIINDIAPHAPVHLLFIPKKHIENLSDTKENDINLLGKINFMAAKILKEKGYDQFKLTTNNGKFAGQEVMHLHYHLLLAICWP